MSEDRQALDGPLTDDGLALSDHPVQSAKYADHPSCLLGRLQHHGNASSTELRSRGSANRYQVELSELPHDPVESLGMQPGSSTDILKTEPRLGNDDLENPLCLGVTEGVGERVLGGKGLHFIT